MPCGTNGAHGAPFVRPDPAGCDTIGACRAGSCVVASLVLLLAGCGRVEAPAEQAASQYRDGNSAACVPARDSDDAIEAWLRLEADGGSQRYRLVERYLDDGHARRFEVRTWRARRPAATAASMAARRTYLRLADGRLQARASSGQADPRLADDLLARRYSTPTALTHCVRMPHPSLTTQWHQSQRPEVSPCRDAARFRSLRHGAGSHGPIGRAIPSPGWTPHRSDAWVDAWLGDMNAYAHRYRDPFIRSRAFQGAPRPLVDELLVRRRWAPADVYYARAIARGLVVLRCCRGWLAAAPRHRMGHGVAGGRDPAGFAGVPSLEAGLCAHLRSLGAPDPPGCGAAADLSQSGQNWRVPRYAPGRRAGGAEAQPHAVATPGRRRTKLRDKACCATRTMSALR